MMLNMQRRTGTGLTAFCLTLAALSQCGSWAQSAD